MQRRRRRRSRPTRRGRRPTGRRGAVAARCSCMSIVQAASKILEAAAAGCYVLE